MPRFLRLLLVFAWLLVQACFGTESGNPAAGRRGDGPSALRPGGSSPSGAGSDTTFGNPGEAVPGPGGTVEPSRGEGGSGLFGGGMPIGSPQSDGGSAPAPSLDASAPPDAGVSIEDAATLSDGSADDDGGA